MSFRQLIIGSLAAVLFSAAQSEPPANFDQAKRTARAIYADRPITFYCACPITWSTGVGGAVDLEACGYQVRHRTDTAARRVEWEHVVPASVLGAELSCWSQGGRSNCRSTDPIYRAMAADLHNLTPAIGEINRDRSNYAFGLLPDDPYQHGECAFRVSFSSRLAQPREEIRGKIARIYFYMHDYYGLTLPPEQEELFIQWDREHPVTPWELERDARIAAVMGRHNPYVIGQRRWVAGYTPRAEALADLSRITASVENQPLELEEQQTAPIIGNRRSRIFHRPNCPSYSRVGEVNRVVFASEEEAVSKGYRVAGNCP
ncbi:endonuclease [Marinimicrobium sp. ABcell2]|uniref:endonuclease n=1 Tax=Marinimicrobium sp. ABcell2 TaxID=3069751 RepID=UPI0027B65A7C|nr:endonuclease [Marinimicrobium sp. ABcell2]MDQ2077413.1 endonuclease [Marinimicrobium sp. ABcell2]